MVLKDIERIQDTLRLEIEKEYKKKNLTKTIELLDCFADVAQRINNILYDGFTENIISRITEDYIVKDTNISNADKKSVVFYDQIGTTTCLGLQYLRALHSNGYKITFIYESPTHPISPTFLKEVRTICTSVSIFNSKKLYSYGVFVGDKIRQIIIDASPSKIIAHQEATGALACAIINSIKGATKYKIIPGDHHFYLGLDAFDFYFEFRRFGLSTSTHERNRKPNKIYKLPYYPIVDEFIEFQGFPFNPKGKIVIGAGGATYKFQGSDVFFDLLGKILKIHKNAVFVFIGNPPQQILDMAKFEEFKDQIYCLGYRRDFAALVKNLDILLNSYPFAGGLFCQTAAYFKKPIVAYTSEEFFLDNCVEDLLGTPSQAKSFTYKDKTKYIDEICQLIENKEYRKIRGEDTFYSLMTKERFNTDLGKILKGRHNTIELTGIKPTDRSKRISFYINLMNTEEPTFLLFPSKVLGISIFWKFSFLGKDLFKHFRYIIVHIMSKYDSLQSMKKNIKKILG